MSKDPRVSPDKARQNAAKVRWFWELGLSSIEELCQSKPSALKYGRCKKTYSKEAKRLGLDIDRAAKARRFAQGYTLAQVDQLCEMIVRERSRFSFTHVIAILRVKDTEKRQRLAMSAIKGSWSIEQLKRAVQAVEGKRRPHVGRKPYVPTDPLQRLLVLDVLAAKFSKWCAEAEKGLPATLKPIVSIAWAAMEVLKTAIPAEVQELRDLRVGSTSRTR